MKWVNLFAGTDWIWDPSKTSEQVYPDYGWFHVYAFTMTLGIILAFTASAVKFYIRKIPVTELIVASIPVIPIGLFGGSFIGKINKDYPGFWEKFQFWQGGMAIHGAVLFALMAALPIFYLIGRYRTKVSTWVYADAILPNVLLGQMVGRWGNFFNHELHGAPVAEVYYKSGVATEIHNPLSWLPKFIYENTQFKWTGTDGVWQNGIQMHYGAIYQTEPIFLYESFSLFLLWMIITFVVPGLGRWISKKPWKLFPNAYNFDIKYSLKYFFTFGQKKEDGKMTYHQIWDDAFYRTYDENGIIEYEKYYREHILSREKLTWDKKIIYWPILLKQRWKDGRAIERGNNPQGYLVTKCGVEASLYLFGWNLVRFILEQRRDVSDALINNDRIGSNLIIGFAGLIGLIGIFMCQFVFPYLFRKPNYQYEKIYFTLSQDLIK